MMERIEEFTELIESGSFSDIQNFFNNLQATDQENLLNSSDACGEYPLHIAVKTNNEDVVKWLIENGADINQTNDWGATPAQSAKNKEYTI